MQVKGRRTFAPRWRRAKNTRSRHSHGRISLIELGSMSGVLEDISSNPRKLRCHHHGSRTHGDRGFIIGVHRIFVDCYMKKWGAKEFLSIASSLALFWGGEAHSRNPGRSPLREVVVNPPLPPRPKRRWCCKEIVVGKSLSQTAWCSENIGTKCRCWSYYNKKKLLETSRWNTEVGQDIGKH